MRRNTMLLGGSGVGAPLVGWALSHMLTDPPSWLVAGSFGLGVSLVAVAVGTYFWLPEVAEEEAAKKTRVEKVRDLVSLKFALLYHFHREWGRNDLGDADRLVFLDAAQREFEDLAINDGLTIWGTAIAQGGSPAPLPPDLWEEQMIDRLSVLEMEPQAKTCYRQQEHLYKYPLQYRLSVNRQDIERLFPRPTWIAKWIKELKMARERALTRS